VVIAATSRFSFLGEELGMAAPPRDVANAIAPLTDDLGRAVETE
jgi:hypothetical protein